VTQKLFLIWIFILFSFSTVAQKRQRDTIIVNDTVGISLKRSLYRPSPVKAAFFSAVLPGLGQIYNKRYWKVPIVYAALGTGIGLYIQNTNEFNRFRDAFRRRLAGFEDDEFFDINGDGINPGNPDISDQALQDAQENFNENRELALIVTIGLYALNIIDANVDAHLRRFNISDDLTFQPFIYQNEIDAKINIGYSLTFKF